MASDDIVVSLPPDPDKVVNIWTDGGCKPNPGPGGWAAILVFRNVVKELSGAEAVTTNNRMELTAAAMALEALTRPCHVVVHTDSQYLQERHHPLDRRLGAQGLARLRRRSGGEYRSVEADTGGARRRTGWSGSGCAAMTATT